MREKRAIKFRAWDKVTRGMYQVLTLKLGAESAYIHRSNLEAYEALFKNIILMQYSGLKDNNGKDIYDGDIVKRSNYCLEIKFENCAFMGVYHDETNGERWTTIGNDMEVIGNVYENPDLLKQNV